MKTVLITGVAGFIGSHLAEFYLRNNHCVIGVDNFLTGSTENITVLKKISEENFFFFQHNVCDDWSKIKTDLQNLISSKKYPNLSKPALVYHLASPAAVNQYQKYSLETLWANSLGLEKALNFADESEARLIFSSTSEVYGSPLNSPQNESDLGLVNSFGPRSCYDEGKRFGEALIYETNRNKTTQHGLVRIFNTYGPRMNAGDGRVVIQFIRQALKHQDLTIYGDGKQTRCFCHVDDLIRGLILYADSAITTPINLGNDIETTVHQLAQLIIDLTQSRSRITFLPALADDPLQRRPDLRKAYEVLRYKPRIDLKKGLLDLIETARQ